MSDIRSLIEKLEQINESAEVNKLIKDAIDKGGVPKTIEKVEDDVKRFIKLIRGNLQSRDEDNFLTSLDRAAKRFLISSDYIQRQYLGAIAEKLGLPGLYALDGKSYVYTDKDQSGNYKSAGGASIEDKVKLYKAGYITRDKAIELQNDNTNVAFKDPKHPSNALFGNPGPAAGWAKTNPIADLSAPKDSTSAASSSGSLPLAGAGRDVDPSLTGAGNNSGVKTFPVEPPAKISTSQSTSEYVSKRLTSADINNLNQFKTDEITSELMNDLRKLLNILNDSKLNFKSDIALGLVESDKLYERDLSASDEEKLRIIVHNLKLLEPKASPVLKARLGNYLEKIPQKYLSVGTPAAPADNTPAAAPATKTEPGASTTTTPKKITWQDLAKLNPQITDPNKIYVGQQIKLPDDTSTEVSKGDTLSGIAQRWNQNAYVDKDSDDAVATPPAAAAPADKAPPAAAAPAAAATATLKPSEATAISIEIKTALMKFRNQDLLDRIWMKIKSKENFDAIDAQFRTTGKKGIIDAVNSEWGYSKDKQFTPMLKRLGIATK